MVSIDAPAANLRNGLAVAPSFRTVFEGNVRHVFRALVHFGVPAADVEDACQEVFVVLHRRLSEIEDPENLRGFLYGIAFRVAAAQRRKAHRKHEIATAEPAAQAVDFREPADMLEERRRLERLARALSTLPDEQRAVFVLYEVEQLAMREVAVALDCSINTAFSRLYAARHRVAAELGIVVPAEVWKR